MTSTTHFKLMTNNTKVAKASFVKQASTAVTFLAAPFALAVGIGASEVMHPQAANAGNCYHSTGYVKPHWTSTPVGRTNTGETIWLTCY